MMMMRSDQSSEEDENGVPITTFTQNQAYSTDYSRIGRKSYSFTIHKQRR